MGVAERLVRGWLEQADITIGGTRPWDIQVHDPRLFQRVVLRGSLGVGEAWMDRWFDCPALDQAIERLFRAGVGGQISTWSRLPNTLSAFLFNMQKASRAAQVGERHYDIGDDLYRAMLDRRMIYSCAWWGGGAADLDRAQEAKLDLIARKLSLEAGMKVLDIGCGWGGAAAWYAEHYGVSVTGVTVSKHQWEHARKTWAEFKVDFHLQDYRDIAGHYDAVYSIGMFEHVGYRNYRMFMDVVRRCLQPEGLFLLHTIGGSASVHAADPWVHRYIFPNGMMPSARQLTKAIEDRFVLEDWHNFGPDYDRTLMTWHKNFLTAWPELAPRYGERFRRMWEYYLLASAATFRARRNHLWQVLLSTGRRREGVVRHR